MASPNTPPVFEGKVESFLDRLESYFLYKKTAQDMKVHVLIVGLSEQKYETVMDLVSPRKPRELPYDELVEVLIQHFGGTHNKMVERAKFRELRRSDQESVNDFVVKLKNTARNCQFGAMLEENLLEQFRIGVNSKPIRDRIALMPIDDQQK